MVSETKAPAHLAGEPEITRFGSSRADNKANVGIAWPGARVLVDAHCDDPDAVAAELAAMPAQLAAARAEIERLRVLVPPARPSRIMGTGCVRPDPTHAGQLWILSKRETGWSAFGYRLDGWDQLLRHWHVVVTGAGTDEHGPYWTVEPAPSSD